MKSDPKAAARVVGAEPAGRPAPALFGRAADPLRPSSAAAGQSALGVRLQALAGDRLPGASADAIGHMLESLLGVDATALQSVLERGVVQGKVDIRVKLVDGTTLTVPMADRSPLRIEIPRSPSGTEACFQLDVGPPSSGGGTSPVLRGLRLWFDTPGREGNPAAPSLARQLHPRVLNPTVLEGPKQTLTERLVATAKDSVADVRVRGAQIDERGEILLTGEVVVAGVDYQDLQELARDQLPTVDTRIFGRAPTSKEQGSAPATSSTHPDRHTTPRGGTPLLDMLRLFAAVAQGGTWRADLDVVDRTAPTAPAAALTVEGRVAINRDLNLDGGMRVALQGPGQSFALEVETGSDTWRKNGSLTVRTTAASGTSAATNAVQLAWDKEGTRLGGLDVDALLPVNLMHWKGNGTAPAFGSVAFRTRIDGVLGDAAPEHRGCEVEALRRGTDVLNKRLEMIDRAGPGDTVLLQTFIFKDDVTGQMVLDALVAAKERGAHVKVLIDAVGSIRDPAEILEGPATFQKLRAAGVDVALFNIPGKPLADALPGAIAGVRRELSRHHKHGLQGAPEMVEGLERAGAKNLAKIIAAVVEAKTPQMLASDPERLVALALAAPKAREELARAGSLLPRAALRELVLLLSDELQRELPQVLRGLGRDHRKQLLVYGEKDGTAFAEMDTGGANIGDDYLLDPGSSLLDAQQHAGLHIWNDIDLHIAGSNVVRQAAAEFDRTWRAQAGGGPELKPVPETQDLVGVKPTSTMRLVHHHPVGVAGHDGDDHYANVLLATLEGLRRGDQIAIENPYFIPLPALRDAMVAAAQRGARIRIVTNGLHANNDNLTVAKISRRFILPDLVAQPNIEVYETLGDAQPIHRKTFVAQAANGSHLYAVGSHNLDHLSARINREMFVLGGSAVDPSPAADGVARGLLEDVARDTLPTRAARVESHQLRTGDLDAIAADWLTSVLLPVL